MLAAIAAGLSASTLQAGPLDPPNGPITSTYKTLTEVEPRIAINSANTPGDADSTFRIAASGSYYLTASFTAASGRRGIEVAASNVTIDLNGFTIRGANGSLDGIFAGSQTGLTVRNGVIFQMGGDGVDASGCSASRFEGLTVLNSGGQGIVVGVGNEVGGCTASNNGSHGINTGDSCSVVNSIARGNGGVGIDVDDNSSIVGCTATENETYGLSLNFNGSISNCTSSLNGSDGIRGDRGTTYTNCAARENNGYGIHAGGGFATLRGCDATANTLDGIYLGERSSAFNCSAGLNLESGFYLLHGNIVKNCTGSFNGLRGITVDGGSNFVSECNFTQNSSSSGIGIISNTGNRIEANNCAFNDFGIFVNAASTSNLIIRNSCRANTIANFQIPNTSDYGAIISHPGAGFTSTNSWANFEF